MTAQEKASLLKTWTFIAVAIGLLGTAAGWGISAGVNANRQANLIDNQRKHEEKLIEHDREFVSLKLVDAERGIAVSNIFKKLDKIDSKLEDLIQRNK